MHAITEQLSRSRRNFLATSASGIGTLALATLLQQEGLLAAPPDDGPGGPGLDSPGGTQRRSRTGRPRPVPRRVNLIVGPYRRRVIPELLNNGHQVVGLARSDASAEAVARLGAEVRRGDLDDLDGLRAAAAEADGVIHLAFKHEAMRTGDFMGAVSADMAATQAIGETLIGTDKPFVSTGGTLMLAMAGPAPRTTSPRAVPGPTRRTTRSVWGSRACAAQSSASRRWSTANSTITASRTR